MAGRWQMFVDERGWTGERTLYIRLKHPSGALGFIKTLVMETTEPGIDVPPTMTETREEQEDALGDVTGFLQAALDEAWRIGMRPKGHEDHTNELTAVRYHLEDMRLLAGAKVPLLRMREGS